MAATYETAPYRFVHVHGIRFAYRRLGRPDGVPLVLLMHYRGTMDHWNPALVNPLATLRPVVLIDNAGVGRSGGQVPETYVAWTRHYTDIVRALGIELADFMGFSMGGCVAQLVALNAPRLVRRLVLCGTVPSAGEGVTIAPPRPYKLLRDAMSADEQRRAFLASFFTSSAPSQAAGRALWERITGARQDRSLHVSSEGTHRQSITFANIMDPNRAQDASFARFHELKMPVLIANGSDDLLLPTENSILMWKKLRHADAQLHLYPDAGHGFLYQYAAPFAALVNQFLDSDGSQDSRL